MEVTDSVRPVGVITAYLLFRNPRCGRITTGGLAEMYDALLSALRLGLESMAIAIAQRVRVGPTSPEATQLCVHHVPLAVAE
jgi:ABC-type Co2+ transport system permease subunit